MLIKRKAKVIEKLYERVILVELENGQKSYATLSGIFMEHLDKFEIGSSIIVQINPYTTERVSIDRETLD